MNRRDYDYTIGICPTCGKRRYATRRHAKSVKKHHPDRSDMSVYRCGEWFHLGHLDPAVKRGELDKESRYRVTRERGAA